MGTCLSMTLIRSTESRTRGFGDKTRKQYSQPSAGSTVTDLANPGSQNIPGEKNPESSKKPKPEFATNQQLFTWQLRYTRNCNWSRDDLQYIEGCAQVMCKYYIPFYIRNLSIQRFWYPRRVLEQIPLSYPKGQLHVPKGHGFFQILIYYLFLAVLGLCHVGGLFSSCRGGGAAV